MIRRNRPARKLAKAEIRRERDTAKEIKRARKQVNHLTIADAADPVEHLYALGRGEGEWLPESPDYRDAIITLTEGHIVNDDDGKLLLRGNRYLRDVTRMAGCTTIDPARYAVCETLPIALLDNKELLDAAFQLWDPRRADGEQSLYETFGDSFTAARLLLQ